MKIVITLTKEMLQSIVLGRISNLKSCENQGGLFMLNPYFPFEKEPIKEELQEFWITKYCSLGAKFICLSNKRLEQMVSRNYPCLKELFEETRNTEHALPDEFYKFD